MAAPSTILARIKDILRIVSTDTTWDSALNAKYDQAMADFALKTDILVENELIDAVKNQHIYTVRSRFARILSVWWNNFVLLRVPSLNLDLLKPTWQTDPSQQPEVYTLDKIPPGLDGLSSILPEQFAVVPAPPVSATGTLSVYEVAVPVDLPITQYLIPYLIFKTAAMFLIDEKEIRDRPSGEFWLAVSDVWYAALSAIVPI